MGPYNSKKSINGPHYDPIPVIGTPWDLYRQPMAAIKPSATQCNVMTNTKTSVVDYYRTAFIVPQLR